MKNGKRRFAEKTVGGKAVRVMWIVMAALLGCIALSIGALALASPGKTVPFCENGQPLAGSVSEKIRVSIDGEQQGMFIRGRSTDNPVLLFMHGGPGMPEFFLTETYQTGLEDHFTVCYWEQRGSGLSYRTGIPGDSITTEQLVSDTIEVTQYLQERFGQAKIYLMAHSWGTFIGIQAAARAPELYHAYIGMAQIVNMAESERRAYAWMVEQYEAAGNDNMVKQLKAYNVLDTQPDTALIPYFKSMLRDNAMHDLGVGTMRDMKSVISGVFVPVMTCRAYTLGEKINLWRAKAFLRSDTVLLEQLFSTDISALVTRLEIPAYFFCGAYDLTVNHDLSEAYCAQLEAPVKGFYLFEQSAHTPMFEEPERFLQVMTEDVLAGKTSLANAS